MAAPLALAGLLHWSHAAETAIDFERAKALHERQQRGESLTTDEEKYLEEAKRQFMARQAASQGAPPSNDGFDWDRARKLYQRKQAGETLSPEDDKFLQEAIKRRQGGGGGGSGGGNSGSPRGERVADEKMLKELVPLTELTTPYKGQDGGLYGAGSNEPPPVLQERASKAAAQIKPLNAEGKPDPAGKIVLLTLGMSNTTMESAVFVQKAMADSRKAPAVVVVDGAQGGKDATAWAKADAQPWTVAGERLKSVGVTPQQVQALWIKQALISPQAGFPAEADRLRDRLAETVAIVKEKYPNVRLVFLSSRIYAGYAVTKLNPEPYAYEGAFAMRDLIQRQLKDDAKGPVLLWGPYLWAAGKTPRKSDGLTYAPEDFADDGTHPGQTARVKVADLLLKFFTTDPNAKSWFVKE